MKRCPRVNFAAIERHTGKTVLHEVKHVRIKLEKLVQTCLLIGVPR